ncbi:MAG: hypothetical protein FJY95_17435 [Candidatus Handelsmanbacteria bacterium]|nr:hypothetical protein [Candidatus Handelsmanbacteria bacterium]
MKMVLAQGQKDQTDLALQTAVIQLAGLGVTAESACEAEAIRQLPMPVAVLELREYQGRSKDLNELLTRVTGIKNREEGGMGSKATLSIHCLEGKRIAVVINLDTMTKTKRIDLVIYTLGDGDNNPEPANSILRDGKRYAALLQEISAFNPHPGAHVVIIDTAADTVIKAISDPRTLSIDGGGTTDSPCVDEKGDLYLYGYGLWGFSTVLDGFLSIRKGEDEFDPTYFFSIKEKTISHVPGNNTSYQDIRTYWGKGVIYGFLNIPANTSNPPDYVNDRNYQPFRSDLHNHVFEKVDLPDPVWRPRRVGHEHRRGNRVFHPRPQDRKNQTYPGI